MEKRLDDYPERIEKYLKPLPLSERMDIVKEIKSDMLDLQRDGKTVDEIIERLGSPKELAKAYLQSGGLFRHVSGSMSHNSGSRLTSLRCSEPSFCGDQMGGCHLSLWMALYGPHRNFYRDRRTTSCGRICGGTPDRTAAVFRGAWLLETVASLLPKS